MSSIPCAWCGKPASRRYPGRYAKGMTASIADCYLCAACDALVRAGKPLPAGVATFSVAVKGDA